MSDYERYENEGSGGGFMMGLLTGTVLGAGLGMLLAPRAGAELRGQIGEQARNLGSMASEQYKKASDSASGWAERGRDVVNQARDVVSRGADEARDYAGATTGASYGSGSGTGTGSGSGSGSGGTGSGQGSGSSYGGSTGSGGSDIGRS